MRMNVGIRKLLVLAGYLVVLYMLTNVAIGDPALAQEEIQVGGEWCGAEMSVPVQLNKGDRIIGVMSINRYNMWARITPPSGNPIECNKVTSCHIDYVAETSGTIHFTFVHLYGNGCPEYNVTYTRYPNAEPSPPPTPAPSPPQSEPTPTPAPPPSTVDSPTWGWIIVGFIVLGIFFAFAAARGRIRRKRLYGHDYEDTGVPSGERHVYHHFPKRCKRCRGTGRVKRPMMLIQRGGPGMKEQYDDCPVCGGTGWVS